MPLIKKRFIHEGHDIKHLGLSKIMGRTEGGALDFEGASNEEEIDASERIREAAEESLEEAKHEAQRIKEAAFKEAEKLKEAAKKEGLETGKQEGLNTLRENIKETQQLIRTGREQRDKIIQSAEPEILKLAVKIAGQVIKSELTSNQNIIMNIVKEAIEKISDNEQVVVKVAQQDLEIVRNHKDLIMDLVEAKNLSIVADKHLTEGGCIIETKLGFIDASINTKLELIEKSLIDVYKEEKIKKEILAQTKREREEKGETIDKLENETEDKLASEENTDKIEKNSDFDFDLNNTEEERETTEDEEETNESLDLTEESP